MTHSLEWRAPPHYGVLHMPPGAGDIVAMTEVAGKLLVDCEFAIVIIDMHGPAPAIVDTKPLIPNGETR